MRISDWSSDVCSSDLRPGAPLLVLTPKKEAARRMGLLWGAHAVPTKDIGSFEEMIAKGKRMALRHGICKAGAKLVMMAGVPFGTPGSTNVLHVATLTGDELRGYSCMKRENAAINQNP